MESYVQLILFSSEKSEKQADRMASMSLEFILCEPAAPRTRKQRTKKSPTRSPEADTIDQSASSPYTRGDKGDSHGKALAPDRQHHVRQLQNLRQRRYRERKKSTASALQATAEQLHQENASLETDILQHFESQLL